METQIKYYIVNNASRASQYGIGTYVRQLALSLRPLSEVTPVYIDLYADVEEFGESRDDDGYVHYRFPACQGRGETEEYCRTIAYIMGEYIDRDCRNVFHFNYFQHCNLAMLLKAAYPDCHIILAVHYLNWCFELNGNLHKFRRIIKGENIEKDMQHIRNEYNFVKYFLHLADSVVVLSRFCQHLLVEDYKISADKLHLVYNGLESSNTDVKGCTEVPTVNPFESSKTIIYVGRLDQCKGINYLLKAFAIISRKHNNTHLIIVGDGDYNDSLKHCEGLWGKVTFTGRITKETLENIYSNTDIGVLPSFNEQCSYSAIEFMRQGIPFIGTDSTGLEEMFDGMEDMRVHIDETNFSEDAFVNELADKISLLFEDSTRRTAVAKAMRCRFAERHTIGMMSEGMRKVIKSGVKSCTTAVVSSEFLADIDNHMMGFINTRPDIDLDFYGMSGIGVYLWWRINSVQIIEYEAYYYRLQEYLIYYLDWLYESASQYAVGTVCDEMDWTLRSMLEASFYKTRVSQLMSLFHITTNSHDTLQTIDDNTIVMNAMRMITTKV